MIEKIIAKKDEISSGQRQRYIIGNTQLSISGALYVDKDVELPCEISIEFKKEEV